MSSSDAIRVIAWLAVLQLASPASGDAPLADRLLVRAEVEGRPVELAFDTCSPHSLVLFREIVDRLETAAGSSSRQVTTLPVSIEIGSESSAVTAVVVDPPFPDIDGFLGWPSLKKGVWQVDWESGIVKPREEPYSAEQGWVVADLVPHVPVAAIYADELRRHAIYLDTGDPSSINLSAEQWRKWSQERSDSPRSLAVSASVQTSEITVVELLWAKQIDIGPLTLADALVQPALHRWPNLHAVLGLNGLRHFDVIFDTRNRRAAFRPRRADRSEIRYNRLAATFAPRPVGSRNFLANVVTGGPGYRSGLRDGDKLLAVNGTDAADWVRSVQGRDTQSSRGWFAEPGTEYSVEVARGEKVLRLQLKLEEIFPLNEIMEAKAKETDGKSAQQEKSG